MLKPPGTKRLKLKHVRLLSILLGFCFNFALKFNLSRYTMGDSARADAIESTRKLTNDWVGTNRPVSVYRFPRRALTLCPQLCMGIQPGARFPARSADALHTTLYGHFTQAMYRNRPITMILLAVSSTTC
jgi:hypothetical protein